MWETEECVGPLWERETEGDREREKKRKRNRKRETHRNTDRKEISLFQVGSSGFY